MKRTINHVTYNTDTAIVITEWDNGKGVAPWGNVDYVGLKIYRTNKGNYFAYVCGGALSAYAADRGSNRTTWGEYIYISVD